ncbi:MAG: helix-turn-helix transcriptional regulator [Elusimicrobia bacterium]|nr:helix-turn-helix transcriptional regulator [Elusimicrobiota bacterium]
MRAGKRKESGLDKFLRASIEGDEEFKSLFLAQVKRLPISTQLRVLRNFRGLSQAALSKKTRIVQPEVARIERADANPKARTLERMAKGLGARVEIVPENVVPLVAAQQVRAQGEDYFDHVTVRAR